MEALKAAVSNGCNAVYLGMQKFGARAYSENFDYELLREAVNYAHLRDVKIFVTMNTIVFEAELEDMKAQLHRLNEIGVDGVIVQDLAVFDYGVQNFTDMEIHCSTQMGIDDAEGTLLFKEMGAKRVVLSREVPIEKVKEIKKIAQIPIEIFVHGALCVSYSGNCLMSGLIGYRSGNRGRCVGSCRKLYELIDSSTGQSLGQNYILSTKDLNTIEHIEDLKAADSLKIEGRMKEPAYVANVVAKYRAALDGTATAEDKEGLNRTFNRTYTEGYLFGEDHGCITNVSRPNNFGFEIGRITGQHRGMYEITLYKVLNQNDIIRIDHGGEDVNLSVVKLYDREGNLINKADRVCYIKIKETLTKGDVVYKTKDYLYYKSIEETLDREFRRFDLNLKVYAYPGAKLVVDAEGLGQHVTVESEELLEEAKSNPTDFAQVQKQMGKLGDTIFTLKNLEFEEYNAFIPVKMLNNARREVVEKLYEARLASEVRRTRTPEIKEPIAFDQPEEAYITASVTTEEQYEACRKAGIREIYYDNIVRRNQNNYQDREGKLLIGGYGGVYRYRHTNPFVADYSFNVVNSAACYELHRLGAERVTLSYELNRTQIGDMIKAYYEANGGYPALEMIVYGRAPLLFTKYCPLRKMGLCGTCKTKNYEIRDEYGSFPVLSHPDLANDNCATTILNGKFLNLMDEMPALAEMGGIHAFRLNFTTETGAETAEIVRNAQRKLAGTLDKVLFNQETDTRGHFNKEII